MAKQFALAITDIARQLDGPRRGSQPLLQVLGARKRDVTGFERDQHGLVAAQSLGHRHRLFGELGPASLVPRIRGVIERLREPREQFEVKQRFLVAERGQSLLQQRDHRLVEEA